MTVLLIVTASIYTVGCSSVKDSTSSGSHAEVEQVDANQVEADTDSFIPRPRFNKPQARPLGRVLLSWDGNDSAEGYEIQMSTDESFSEISRNWMVNGLNLELPIDPESVMWFRIRSFNQNTSSRWSAVLKVEEKLL